MLYRVVIVEDDPMVSLLDRTYTEKDPRFRVAQTFQDGHSALEWLTQNPTDLVVLDVYMPLFTGLELLQALRHRDISVDAVAGGEVTQSALDRLFSPAGSVGQGIPKGLQEDTLERVRQCLRTAPPQGLPSEAVSRQTGLSVVTVRRYVNYLVERGEAASSVNYDTGGRPCRLYRFQT